MKNIICESGFFLKGRRGMKKIMLGFCMSLRAKRSNPGSERWLMDCHADLYFANAKYGEKKKTFIFVL